MNLKKIRSLAKKEFFGFLHNPLAYTIIVPFLLLSNFLYLRIALVNGEASLRPYFELLPWFLLFLAPALAMRLLAEEEKEGTMELLLAHPLTELEIISGKFFGTLAFFVFILSTSLSLPLSLIIFSRPDLGQILGQYLGAIFLGATFLAVGLAASAYVRSALGGFLLGAALSFVLIIVGLDFFTLMLPFPFNRLAAEISVLNHSENVSRGLLDIRDLFYFLTVVGIMLSAALLKISERKTAERPKEDRKIKLALGMILAIGFLANFLLSSYPLRIDLTQNRLFSLSAGTKETLKNLDDLLTLTLYVSGQLPAQMQLIARDVLDLLKNYEKLSKKVKVKIVHPEESSEALSQTREAGIEEVQFNTLTSGKFEAQSGFLGIGLRFGEKTESLPFIAQTADLEYQLTRRIKKLTSPQEKIIGFYKNGFSPDQTLRELLSTQYKLEMLKVDDEQKLENLSLLLAVDEGVSETTASALLQKFLGRGGKVLLLAGGMWVDRQILSGQKSRSQIASFLSDYGVTLNSDLVYDLQLSEIISFSDRNQQYLSQYPYWLKALPAVKNFPPLSTVKSVSLAWPSSLTLTPKEGVKQEILLTTGNYSGKKENVFSVALETIRDLKPETPKIPLAALIEKGESKIVVVGSASLASDQFLQGNSDNLAFLGNLVDYLSAEKNLASIPLKSAGRPVFEFKNAFEVFLFQYGNLFLPPLGVSLFAIFYLRRRKILTKRVYVR